MLTNRYEVVLLQTTHSPAGHDWLVPVDDVCRRELREYFNNSWIELFSRTLGQKPHRFIMRHRRGSSWQNHSIIFVGKAEDAAEQRYLFGSQTLRSAAAVKILLFTT